MVEKEQTRYDDKNGVDLITAILGILIAIGTIFIAVGGCYYNIVSH
jgi:hypothetical protein